MDLLSQFLEQARQRRSLPPPAVRRVLREQAGLSQHDVALALGIDRATVSRYESGQRAPRRRLVARYISLLARLATEVAEQGR